MNGQWSGLIRAWFRLLSVLLSGLIVGCAGEGPEQNQPPTVAIGADQTVQAEETVTLNGSGSSDPDGDTLIFAWEQTQGTAVILSSTSDAVVTFTAPGNGTVLQFELTVSDGVDSAADSTTITVQPVEQTARVVELNQPSVHDDPAVTGDFPRDWELGEPPEPLAPPSDKEEVGEFFFAPVTIIDLAPGESGEIELELDGPSGLAGSARWVGTRSPLEVSISLNDVVLETGTSYAFGIDRGGSYLEALAMFAGVAKLTVTNTSDETVKVRLALGAAETE